MQTNNTTWQESHLQAMQTQSWPVKDRWLESWQQEHLQLFLKQGFPTRRDEAWKYTPVTELVAQNFMMAQTVSSEIDIANFALADTYRMVFVNGRYMPSLSDIEGLPKEVVLTNNIQAYEHQKAHYQAALCKAQQQPTSFTALNAALLSEGLFLWVPANTIIKKPIHLLYLNTDQPALQMNHPRHLIITEDNSRVDVFAEYCAIGSQPYFNNIVTQLFVAQNARVNFYKLQRENNAAFHVANLTINQQQNSEVNAYHFAIGAKLSRDDLNFALQSKGASCQSLGFYYPQGNQHIDFHSRIDHLVEKTTSEQHYKGILQGSSSAVFNGKVIVHPQAKQTNAKQSNKNLLLTQSAQVNTKPELEIYNDDVVCSHGATVGELDWQALFYLQSRGIDQESAKHMLACAFASEILAKLPAHAVSEHIKRQVINQLASECCQGGCYNG